MNSNENENENKKLMNDIKDKGNKLFNDKKYNDAINEYNNALNLLSTSSTTNNIYVGYDAAVILSNRSASKYLIGLFVL